MLKNNKKNFLISFGLIIAILFCFYYFEKNKEYIVTGHICIKYNDSIVNNLFKLQKNYKLDKFILKIINSKKFVKNVADKNAMNEQKIISFIKKILISKLFSFIEDGETSVGYRLRYKTNYKYKSKKIMRKILEEFKLCFDEYILEELNYLKQPIEIDKLKQEIKKHVILVNKMKYETFKFFFIINKYTVSTYNSESSYISQIEKKQFDECLSRKFDMQEYIKQKGIIMKYLKIEGDSIKTNNLNNY